MAASNLGSYDIIPRSKELLDIHGNRFSKLLVLTKLNGRLLSGYIKDDPRAKNHEADQFESTIKSYILGNESLVKLLTKDILLFYEDPDAFDFWKYILLNKYIYDLENISSEEIPNYWIEIENFGIDLYNCSKFLVNLNISAQSEEITEEQYLDGLNTFVACYLALSLNSEECDENVKNLIMLLVNNDSIDGAEILNTPKYDWGEYAVVCRRMLEELTNVRIECPEGIDWEEDAYFDKVDWESVSDQILRKLA